MAGLAMGYLCRVLFDMFPRSYHFIFHILFCGALFLVSGISIWRSRKLTRDAHLFTKQVIAEIERKQRERNRPCQ